VLHTARLREVLRELAVAMADDAAIVTHEERRGAGGALIEGEDGRQGIPLR